MSVATIEYHAGTYPDEFRPGKDFILVSEKAFASRVIQFGQRLRFRGPDKPYALLNHAASVVTPDGKLIQELGNGIQETTPGCGYNGSVEDYINEYVLVRVNMSDEQAQMVLAYLKSCIGQKYGFATIFSDALWCLTDTKFYFGLGNQKVCSGTTAMGLFAGGQLFPEVGLPTLMVPAALGKHYNVDPQAINELRLKSATLKKAARENI